VCELLAKNPADRPASAAAVRARLAATAGYGQAGPPTLVLGSAARVYRGASVTRRLREHVPAWLAALVAGAVATTVLAAVVLLSRGEPPAPQAVPARSPTAPAPANDTPATVSPTPPMRATPTPTPPIPRPRTPMKQILALAGSVAAQADRGELDRKAARDLLKQIGEVARELQDGKPDQAADKFTEVRQTIDELREDGELTRAGYEALPDLDQIAGSLEATTQPTRPVRLQRAG
jgi:serine/threonine-protein kinase